MSPLRMVAPDGAGWHTGCRIGMIRKKSSKKFQLCARARARCSAACAAMKQGLQVPWMAVVTMAYAHHPSFFRLLVHCDRRQASIDQAPGPHSATIRISPPQMKWNMIAGTCSAYM